MKRLLSVLLAVALILGSVANLTALPLNVLTVKASAVDPGLEFNLNDDGVSYRVSAKHGTDSVEGVVTIPSYYNGLPVTKISAFGFADKWRLRGIKIPSTVKIIGSEAFRGSGLREIVIPDSVCEIGGGVFGECGALTKVVLSKNITALRDSYDLYSNNSYDKYIGFFEDCSSLASIKIPDNIRIIEEETFHGTKLFNTESNWVNGALYIGNVLIDVKNARRNYAIKPGTRTIADDAFLYQSEVTSLSVPSSVVNIGAGAFEECTNMYFSSEPKALEYVGPGAFSDTKQYYDYGNDGTKNEFYFGKCLVNVKDSRKLKLRPDTTALAASLFAHDSFLKTIVIPNGVKVIGDSTFSYCKSLENIVIPDSVKEIYRETFEYCDNLKSINIPKYLKYVPEGFIRKCPLIEKVKMPNTITYIGEDAFCDCEGLKLIGIPSSVKFIDDYAFFKTLNVDFIGYAKSYAQKYAKAQNTPFHTVATPHLKKASNEFTGIKVSWNAVNLPVDRYKIYRKTASTEWSYVASTKGTSYLDLNAPSGQTVYYTVRADVCGILSNYEAGVSATYLAPPKISKLSNVVGGVKVYWNKVNGAVTYRVYRHYGDGKWKYVGKTSSTYLVDKGAVSGKTIYYTVRSEDKYKKLSAYYDGKTILYLAAVNMLKATNTVGGVNITWDKVAGAQYYRIYRHTGDGKWKYVTKVSASNSSYTDKSAYQNKSNYYTVRAERSIGGKVILSGYENGLSAVYMAAPHVTGVSNVLGGVNVRWKGVTGASYYRIYRRTPKTNWKYLGVVSSKYTSFTDKNALSGQQNIYTVRAENSAKKLSAYEKGLTILYLKAPKILKVTSVVGGVNVTWEKVPSAENYRIYRRTPGGKWKYIKNISATSTSYLDKTAPTGQTLYYTVRAGNDNTLGYFENGLSVKYVAAPHVLNAVYDSGNMCISWTGVSGADYYRVYRKTGTSDWKYLGKTIATKYYDKTASNSSDYMYTVRAEDNGVLSDFEAGVKSLAMAKVTKLTSTTSGVKVYFGTVSGATNYRIYCHTGDGKWKLVGSTKTSSYLDAKAPNGKTLYYTVRAENSTGLSGYEKGLSVKR